MLNKIHVSPEWVVRRVGGLEATLTPQSSHRSVVRRVGGLEVVVFRGDVGERVVRRVGGLEAASGGRVAHP